ncbi:PLP-dependent transferase, partial [Corynebacterium sanguinis]
YRLIQQVFTLWGVSNSVVNMTDAQAVAAAVQDNTKAIWVESPTNPLLDIADIRAIAQIKGDAALVVDNTFASPYLQKPFELGADIVVHSTTKYIGGHSDVIGGVVCANGAEMEEQLRFFFGWVGAIPSPFDTYLTARGLKTLAVRMDRHCDNAEAVAGFLEGHDTVARVCYPGLESHPNHDTAVRQMKRFGGMVSVIFHTEQQAHTFCRSTKLFCLAESLGGV